MRTLKSVSLTFLLIACCLSAPASADSPPCRDMGLEIVINGQSPLGGEDYLASYMGAIVVKVGDEVHMFWQGNGWAEQKINLKTGKKGSPNPSGGKKTLGRKLELKFRGEQITLRRLDDESAPSVVVTIPDYDKESVRFVATTVTANSPNGAALGTVTQRFVKDDAPASSPNWFEDRMKARPTEKFDLAAGGEKLRTKCGPLADVARAEGTGAGNGTRAESARPPR